MKKEEIQEIIENINKIYSGSIYGDNASLKSDKMHRIESKLDLLLRIEEEKVK